MKRQQASVLIGVLWCLALLAVLVIGVLHTARLDLMVSKNYGDKIQAHYLAVAGVEKAKAVLFHDAMNRRGVSQNHTKLVFDDPEEFRDVHFGTGRFQVFRRGRSDEGGDIIYGVSDEESRLNVNTADLPALTKLPGMTPDVVAAIMDWRDNDNTVSPGGAEADYYADLKPPYQPRNDALQTVRELLMVRGVSQDMLFGDDVKQNELLETGDEGSSSKRATVDLDPGWAGLLTVNSTVKNLNAAGRERVNVQQASEKELSRIPGITAPMAKAIVAARGKKQLQSLADLLDVTAPQPGANAQSADNSGPKVISEDLLLEIADDITTGTDQETDGLINVNSAGLAVLQCLPGIDADMAQAIIAYRQSSGFLPNIAWLLKVPGMTHEIFKQVAPHVTARSETYRIICEGKVTSTGARQRIEEIVRVGTDTITTVSYREDL